MKVIICKDYEEMSKKVCEISAEIVKNKPESLISFPGGDTPKRSIENFVYEVNQGNIDISQTRFVSLDEWVTLSKDDEGSCGHFLEQTLFSKLENNFKDQYVLNGANEDVEAERLAHENYIKEFGPLDLSILGIGLNGHLGFNESGVDFSLDSHIIDLDDVTKKVMVKYFGENFKPERGLTQGINQIMNAKTVIVIANGEHKADIVKKALQGEVTNLVPASVLQNHENCYFIVDEAAGSKL